MSEIEEQLERATELAASRASLRNASDVRARGAQRRRRRRIANGTLGVAALATAVALGATMSGGAPDHSAPVGSNTPTTTSPTASTRAPSTTPGSTGLASAPAGGMSASTTPTSTTTATRAAPNPTEYIAGAWLTAGQEPYGDQITWHQIHNLYGTRIGGSVFDDTGPISGAAGLSMDVRGDCPSQGFAPSLAGVLYQMFIGPINGDTNSDNLTKTAVAEEAGQGIYFYPSATAAEAAWSQISSEWHSCAAQQTTTEGGIELVGSVERTLDQPDAQCWSDLVTEPSLGPNGATVYHACYVVHGDLIEWVDVTVEPVDSFSSPLDAGSTDATTLANMGQSLAAYGGG